MQISRQEKFKEFLVWFGKHIKGKEKSEAQIFLDRLMQSFGNLGVFEAGAKIEDPVKKKSGKTGFVDMVWSDRVIIEMKGRDENLKKHYAQAAEYWFRLTPKPQYMVLCNFDEFWIYDFNIQVDDPVHILKTSNLADDFVALSFLFPKAEKPIFNNNNVEVTENAAQIIGSIYQSLLKRKVDQERAQRFVLQIVVSLFSEDVGLIPEYTVYKILEDVISKPRDSEEFFAKEMKLLFSAMATKIQSEKPKKYAHIPYFNGGLFSEVEPVELKFKEIDTLATAAKEDWSRVRPSIFGSIFESSLDPKKRHENGVHYTHEIDIYKIVNPTIIKPLRNKIEAAGNKKAELKAILKEISEFRVLDPACGSGNFLYVAFKELRRLEVEVLELIDKKFDPNQMRGFALVSPKNFYGIDTNKFGLELAKIALSIGRKLSCDELNFNEQVLPFEDLDDNFSSEDALFTEWPAVDAIIGNPPFLGRGKTKSLDKISKGYVKRMHGLFPKKEFPRSADYCCYWFRKAHVSTANYIGLVGSNSISQGNSRKASLDYVISNGGIIHNAISTQPWEGDAKVHVSLVNWTKEKNINEFLLDGKTVGVINSSLKDELDVTKALKIEQNLEICFQGVVPQPLERYLVNENTALEWIEKNKENFKVVKRLLSADDLTDRFDFKPDRFLIDFNELSIESASEYKEPFLFVKDKKENNIGTNNPEHKNWWQLWRSRPNMKNAIKDLDKYITMPGHSKWFIPVLVPKEYLAYVNSSFVIASKDFYLFGLLTSKLHRDWIRAQSSTIKADTRYTNTTCFETFPFIWNLDEKSKNIIRDQMEKLDSYRLKMLAEKKCGITSLYNEFYSEPQSQLFQLHTNLNRLVCENVYGWKYEPEKNYNAELFELNKKLAAVEKQKSDKGSKSEKKSKKTPKKAK